MVENEEELRLFRKFSEQLVVARQLLDQKEVDNARELYLMLLNTYNKMMDSDYKEISFTNLAKLRQEIEK